MTGYLLSFGAISFIGALLRHGLAHGGQEVARVLFAFFLGVFVIRLFVEQHRTT